MPRVGAVDEPQGVVPTRTGQAARGRRTASRRRHVLTTAYSHTNKSDHVNFMCPGGLLLVSSEFGHGWDYYLLCLWH